MLCGLALLAALTWLLPGGSTLRQAVRYLGWKLFSDVHSASFTAHGVELHYLDAGQGESLVFLHGGGADRDVFFAQLPRFAANYRVIALDSRGHGRSMRGTEKLSYALYARDLAALLDHLGIEHATLIGWSDGGNTALRFALDFPDQVCRLVLISANFHPSGLRGTPAAASVPGLEPDHGSWSLRTAKALYRLLPAARRKPAREAELRELWHSLPQLGVADLGRIQVPALILAGQHDLIDPDHQYELDAALKRSSVHILKGIGHGVPYEAADAVNHFIEKFLNQEKDVTCRN